MRHYLPEHNDNRDMFQYLLISNAFRVEWAYFEYDSFYQTAITIISTY